VNYYPHHIGDFNAGTVRFERLERWIYRDMIEVYYDTEQPLPADLNAICRKIGVRSEEERAIVQMLLDEKFTLEADGYHHERCDAEIAEYRAKADTARENGRKGGRPKKATANPEKPSGFQSGSDPVATWNPEETESKANQEPRTNNQEPEEKSKGTRSSSASAARFDARKWLAERGVEDQHITDWFAARAKKRLPNTLTAFQVTAREAEKAGMSLKEAVEFSAGRGYGGFNAEMVQGGRQSALDLAKQVQQKAGSRSAGNTTQKSRFDLKSTQYDGPTDAPFDF
jgi:uncharacterized protein YdaU (DUF1376 family)